MIKMNLPSKTLKLLGITCFILSCVIGGYTIDFQVKHNGKAPGFPGLSLAIILVITGIFLISAFRKKQEEESKGR